MNNNSYIFVKIDKRKADKKVILAEIFKNLTYPIRC